MKKLADLSKTRSLKDEAAFKKLVDMGYEFVTVDPTASDDEIIKGMQGVEGGFVSLYGYLSEAILDKCPDLKFLAFMGAGYTNSINDPGSTKNGICIMNAPGGNANAVAELAIGLTLDALRNITYTDIEARKFINKASIEHELGAMKVGVFGLGHIGTRVCTILKKGFGADVSYCNRTRKENIEKDLGINYLAKDELLKNSDVVILTVAETDDTRFMIGEREFGLMKNTAILVNPSRPHLVDGTALYNALKNNKIAKAAFDAHYADPLPKDASGDKYGLMALGEDKFILTPHTAWMTREAVENISKMSVDNVLAFLEGNPINNVNPDYKKNVK